MNIGISVPLPAYHVDVAFIAREAEKLGFESLWCAEHPFVPVRTTSRFPGAADGVIPESYSHFVDPFVALARASGVTSTIARAPARLRSRAVAAGAYRVRYAASPKKYSRSL